MTVQLPARAAFPDFEPLGSIDPGLPHYDQHVDDIAESQNFEAAYYGRMHASQAFTWGLQGAPYADTTKRLVLTYLVIPRMHCKGLKWMARIITGAAATITIDVDCLENGETSQTIDVGPGAATRYMTGTFDVMREDQLTTIDVSMTASTGSVQMECFCLYDEDLAAADLHFDYYATPALAGADSLVRYWALQEDDDAGTNATGVDTMASGDDLSAFGSVKIGSAVVNADRAYHRVFASGDNDYMQGTYSFSRKRDFTWMLEIHPEEDTNVHTFLSTGVDLISLAGNAAAVELAVNGVVDTWAAALPFTEMKCLFVVQDYSAAIVTLYEADGAGTVTQRAQRNASCAVNGTSIRLARGYAGDANHDDTDYLDDGAIRSCAIWYNKPLSLMEMNAAARHARVRGALMVRTA